MLLKMIHTVSDAYCCAQILSKYVIQLKASLFFIEEFKKVKCFMIYSGDLDLFKGILMDIDSRQF